MYFIEQTYQQYFRRYPLDFLFKILSRGKNKLSSPYFILSNVTDTNYFTTLLQITDVAKLLLVFI